LLDDVKGFDEAEEKVKGDSEENEGEHGVCSVVDENNIGV
jgi:hypothetical protein